MLQEFKEKVEANVYYPEDEIVDVFQQITEGLTQDCEQCKNYRDISSIADYTRTVTSELGAMQGTNNENFIAFTLSAIVKTIELFEKVPDHFTVVDLTVSTKATTVAPRKVTFEVYKH